MFHLNGDFIEKKSPDKWRFVCMRNKFRNNHRSTANPCPFILSAITIQKYMNTGNIMDCMSSVWYWFTHLPESDTVYLALIVSNMGGSLSYSWDGRKTMPTESETGYRLINHSSLGCHPRFCLWGSYRFTLPHNSWFRPRTSASIPSPAISPLSAQSLSGLALLELSERSYRTLISRTSLTRQ